MDMTKVLLDPAIFTTKIYHCASTHYNYATLEYFSGILQYLIELNDKWPCATLTDLGDF